MGEVVDIKRRVPPPKRWPEGLTQEKLLDHYEQAVANWNALDKGLQSIAEAVFREGDSERPGDLDDLAPDEILEGVRSLHELTDRLYAENETLRAELQKARAR